MPLLDLLPCELGLFRAQVPGVSFARRRPGQTVIRAVTRFGVLLAGAACFTAFHGALGDRPPAHRFRLRQNGGQFTKAHNTDDYTMGTSWGAWEDNVELQKDAADTANNKFTKRDISDIKVSVYGNNTAIARYKESYDLMIKGQHRTRTILTTDTWVNEKGMWKLAASHSSQADQKIGD